MFTNESDYSIKYPREVTILASVCAISFCIVGVIGNGITVAALIRCPKLRCHATTAFVLSLCISDLIFCALNMPVTAARYIHESWRLGDVLCSLFPFFFYGNVAVSLLNMVAITLNRYILIAYHRCYNQLYSTTSIVLQLIFCWGFAFLILLPPYLGVWGQMGFSPSTFSCTILDKNGVSPKKAIFLVGFALPCVAITISYSCIYWSVRKSRNKLKLHAVPGIQDKKKTHREKEDARLTKLMFLIFVCFLICFLPLVLMNVLDDKVRYPTLHVIASICEWGSSVINPFVYAVSNRQYRTAYAKLFNLIKAGITFSSSQVVSGTSHKNNYSNDHRIEHSTNIKHSSHKLTGISLF